MSMNRPAEGVTNVRTPNRKMTGCSKSRSRETPSD
jgi:hypothetical protein